MLELQEKAAKALKGLKSVKEEVAKEHRSNFASYTSTKRKQPFLCRSVKKRHKLSTSWTHTFVCLAGCNSCKVPGTVWERELLREAGLGEKKILFPDSECSAEDYKQELCDSYPRLLDSGGFELMRCCSNSRNLEPLPHVVLQSPKATQECVGRSKVYIRPIQRDLDITPVEVNAGDKDDVSKL